MGRAGAAKSSGTAPIFEPVQIQTNGRNAMKKISLALSCLLLGAVPLSAQQAVPEIAFDSVPNFLKLPPDMHLGEAAGVAVNSKGHIFVFNRGNTSGPAYGAAAAQVLEFAADGSFIREIGKNLYAWSYAHDIRIDRHDNIWAMDKGSDVVVKFNPEGRVDMVFGRKAEASDENAHPLEHPNPPLPAVDGQFRQVTDAAFDSNDNVFISDGYVNSRIAKIDKDGNWVKSWGDRGTAPGQFNTPHGIGVDNAGNVYVADRNNGRIQVFDNDGKFLREMRINVPVPAGVKPMMGPVPAPGATGAQVPGAPWTICITPGPKQFLYTSDSYPGRIYKMTLDGKVVGVLGRAGKQLKQFGWIHEIACPDENTLIVAELLTWRVQKLILKP